MAVFCFMKPALCKYTKDLADKSSIKPKSKSAV